MRKWSILKAISITVSGLFAWALVASPESCAVTTDRNNVLKVDAYCSFYDAVKKNVTLASTPTDFATLTNVQVKLQQLKAYFGKAVNFKIGLTDINTAAAVRSNSQKYILYNEKFYYKLMRQAGTEWGPLSVFAHEIAHHLESHLLPKSYSDTRARSAKQDSQVLIRELEADWFSGRILAKMGATRSEATEAVRKVIPEDATATHPARAARLAIIENGWDSVCNVSSSCSSKQANETDILAIDQFRHDLSKLKARYTCRLKGQQLLIDDRDQIFWIKFPSHPVGKRIPTSNINNCRYELALLGKKHCGSWLTRRKIKFANRVQKIKAAGNIKFRSNLCAPCENGLCP